jgi:hypothetical protein
VAMPLFHLGILCGLILGALSVVIMLPVHFAEKRSRTLGRVL